MRNIGRSIFSKLFLSSVISTMFILCIAVIFSFNTIKSNYINDLKSDLYKISRTLELEVLNIDEKTNIREFNDNISKLGRDLGIRITLVKLNGVVVADSEEDVTKMDNHGLRPEITLAMKNTMGASMRYSKTVKRDMLYVAIPVKKSNKLVYILRTSMYVTEIDILLAALKNDLLKVFILSFLFTLISSWFIARNISNPIKLLGNASTRIANGDFNAKVFLKRNDELKELADHFNEMSEKNRILFTELSAQKKELDQIVYSLHEGILLIDSENIIKHYNKALSEIFIFSDEIKGLKLYENIPDHDLLEIIKDTRETKRFNSKEIKVDNKIFIVSTVFIHPSRDVLVVFNDITAIKIYINQKKTFVDNASHELKTPLTSIKGYVETISEKIENQEIKEHIKIIKRNTDRMINIIEDLLKLSELENKKNIADFKLVNINELISRIIEMFQQNNQKSNITIETDYQELLSEIRGDKYKLEQVFINLIDNAIKYTDKGTVLVSTFKEKNNIVVEVKDTGIGIPEEDKERVFERFFVVDKSRSRKLGGTGLGLAIVKHIVLMHNGTIGIESKKGKGTTVRINFPV